MNEEQPHSFISGKITRLIAQKKNPDRVSVYIEEEYALGLYQDIVLEYGLAVGKWVSTEELQQLRRADLLMVVKTKALNYLSHRARTRFEVRQKLIRSGFDEELVNLALQRLDDLGYLDDDSYARDYVRSRIRNRGYGPDRIRNELLRRGVDSSSINNALEEAFTAQDVLEIARVHAQKRWNSLKREPDRVKRKRKLVGFLLRRGFNYDTVYRVVAECERLG